MFPRRMPTSDSNYNLEVQASTIEDQTMTYLIKNSILLSFFTILFFIPTLATEYVVTNPGTGAGSFQEAVMLANADPNDDVIVFADPVSENYEGGGIVEPNGTLTIEGRGANAMKISNSLSNSFPQIIKISRNGNSSNK